MSMLERLEAIKIIPVIKIDTAEHAVPLAKALVEGGLPAAEITFRSDAAEESIRRIHEQVPEMLTIAGTVLQPETAQRAVKAGAEGIVSPGYNLETIRWCNQHQIPIIPGVATPSEVEACMREGLTTLKLFPAEVVGGVGMLKALSGPYSNMRFMPTGGVNTKNIKEYLIQKNVLCCGGTWIVPMDLLKEEKFEEIRKIASEAAAIRDSLS